MHAAEVEILRGQVGRMGFAVIEKTVEISEGGRISKRHFECLKKSWAVIIAFRSISWTKR
jgi:hypothetical protein